MGQAHMELRFCWERQQATTKCEENIRRRSADLQSRLWKLSI